MTRNIVLLSSHSRESAAKEKQYRAAASRLDLEVAGYPDSNTLGVFACSDFRSVDAANLAALHGVPGPEVLATTIATQKSLAYRFFAQRGFSSLWAHAPLRTEDLKPDLPYAIIVKPDKGSGSFAEHPWAYQRYDSLRHFHDWLVEQQLLEAFLAYQNDPNSWYGRYLTMEYIGDSDVYTAAAVAGPNGVSVYECGRLRFTGEALQCEWMLLGDRHARHDQIGEMIQALYDIGLRHSVIYIQCVEKDGQLCAIDINLRPGTMPDRAFHGLGLPFYQAALAYMLGSADSLDFTWVAPYVGIRRVVLPLEHGRRKVGFGAGCVPLIEEVAYDSNRPFDLGHAWPMFAVTGQDATQCARLAESLVSDMRLSSLAPL
ncbi:hypothetical protein [Achromobacter sp. SLBN-14]|uniref:hypothetical protein n=1 Tax=Achromobacter sp. SLBN-14 TaxID=2768442 RepID=UPI001152A55E|nr:hypothetical protein [Achromobacter sp. SLBN-14]TQJ96182.1 hypothetical protein FBY20_2958 [Achromobacter sp. SLBN-14]